MDWDDLVHYGGKLAMWENVDKALQNLLKGLATMLWALSIIFLILSASVSRVNFLYPRTLLELLPWVGVVCWCYALFLGRDRNRFGFSAEQKQMSDVRSMIESQGLQNGEQMVEVNGLLSFEMFKLIDRLYHTRPDEFMSGLISEMYTGSVGRRLWERLGLQPSQVEEAFKVFSLNMVDSLDSNYAWFFPALFQSAWELESEKIDEVALFFALFRDQYLNLILQLGIQAAELQALVLWVRNEHRKQVYRDKWEKMSLLKPKGVVDKAYTSRYAPTLEKYGEDYTRQAATGKFVITLGKEQAMVDMLRVLQKQNNAAVMLVGDPGVGKTQFLKHLAVRMVVEDVPKILQDKRLVMFNFGKAFTQNLTLENFKLTLQTVLSEVAAAKNIILVMDDIDQLLNIRADLQSEIVSLLVSAIDRHNLRIVGTCSVDGYNRFVKPVRNLDSLFQRVLLAEPDNLISLQILIDQAGRYEAQYGVKIQVTALRQIVNLAPKYAYERAMPDKAIDLLEEVILDVRDKGARFITADDVSSVVSKKVGVTVGQISRSESEVLLKLEDTMHKRVVGQQVAIRSVAAALRRSRAGLTQGKRPIASFLFFGPTGVGKTEVARTLAQTYYGDEKMMIRIDMSEYQEERNLDRLIGFTENGKFINGFLTEAVRSKPFSLILLDEIEKANPKVMDLFLQVLDEGGLTDGAGRKIDFSNTIIIATSNAGSREIAELIGEGMKYEVVYDRVIPRLKQTFRVEFLNRFDKIIMFKPLLPVEVGEIAVRMLGQINENLLSKGMNMRYSPKLIEDLVRMGYDPIYGAREIRRVIQDHVEDAIAERVVSGKLVSGKEIYFESLQDIR